MVSLAAKASAKPTIPADAKTAVREMPKSLVDFNSRIKSKTIVITRVRIRIKLASILPAWMLGLEIIHLF